MNNFHTRLRLTKKKIKFYINYIKHQSTYLKFCHKSQILVLLLCSLKLISDVQIHLI